MAYTSEGQEPNYPEIAYIDIDSMDYEKESLISDIIQIVALIVIGGIFAVVDAISGVANFIASFFKSILGKK